MHIPSSLSRCPDYTYVLSVLEITYYMCQRFRQHIYIFALKSRTKRVLLTLNEVPPKYFNAFELKVRIMIIVVHAGMLS